MTLLFLYAVVAIAAFALGWTVKGRRTPQKHLQVDDVVIRLGERHIAIEADGRFVMSLTCQKEVTYLDA